MEPFVDITDEEKKTNIPSGVLSLSDGHYFDMDQDYDQKKDLSKNIIDYTKQNVLSSGNDLRILNSGTSILAPSALNFQSGVGIFVKDSYFSNGPKSRDLSITDFTIFNPYIHYTSKSLQESVLDDTVDPFAVKINTSTFLNEAVERFNIYSTQFRN